MAYCDIRIVSTLKCSSLPFPWRAQHQFNAKLYIYIYIYIWPRSCTGLKSALVRVGNVMTKINLIDGFKDAMKSQVKV